jgi:hypothetical protein
MHTIRVHVADGPEVERTSITIDKLMPRPSRNGDDTIERTQRLFAADAKAIADALWDALPGGTISQLCVEMLTRQASLFRVPMPRVDVAS